MGDLTKHFSKEEFECKCGCGLNRIDPKLGVIAEIIREHEGGNPMSINSGCRCVGYNEVIQLKANPNYTPYTSNSWHLPKNVHELINDWAGICHAGDFASEKPKILFNFLDNLFPDTFGIGLYNWGVHVDTRQSKARWGNK